MHIFISTSSMHCKFSTITYLKFQDRTHNLLLLTCSSSNAIHFCYWYPHLSDVSDILISQTQLLIAYQIGHQILQILPQKCFSNFFSYLHSYLLCHQIIISFVCFYTTVFSPFSFCSWWFYTLLPKLLSYKLKLNCITF